MQIEKLHIEKLHIEYCPSPLMLLMLSKSKNLTEVEILHVKLEKDEVEEMLQCLSHFETLNYIHLCEIHIPTEYKFRYVIFI